MKNTLFSAERNEKSWTPHRGKFNGAVFCRFKEEFFYCKVLEKSIKWCYVIRIDRILENGDIIAEEIAVNDSKKRGFLKIFRYLMKRLIVIAVIAAFFYFGKVDWRNAFYCFDYRYVLPALFFYLLHIAFVSWRWRKLTLMQGIPMGNTEAFSLTMQGVFFSLILPGGAIGGDVVKIVALSNHLTSGQRTEGAFTILIDRIVGMIALFLLTLILLIFSWRIFFQVSIPGISEKLSGTMLLLLLCLVCAGGIVCGIGVFCHRLWEKLPLFNRLVDFLEQVSKGKVSRLFAAADIYRKKWHQLLLHTLLSIFCVHLMTVVPLLFLLAGTGESVKIMPAVTALTIGNIAGLIPIFPGGIGGRDVTAVALMVAGGISSSGAEMAQLLYTAVMVLCNLSGGIFFIADPGRRAVK